MDSKLSKCRVSSLCDTTRVIRMCMLCRCCICLTHINISGLPKVHDQYGMLKNVHVLHIVKITSEEME